MRPSLQPRDRQQSATSIAKRARRHMSRHRDLRNLHKDYSDYDDGKDDYGYGSRGY